MATYICTQCGHENEGERIYCHNCGVKLDRSLLPVEEEKKPEAPEKVRKRILRMTNPARGLFTFVNLMTFVRTILWGAAIAVIVQVARTPDDVPPPAEKGVMVQAPQIASRLEDAMDAKQPEKFTMTEKEINDYLLTTVKSKENTGMGSGLKFIRSFVHCYPDNCDIHMELTLYGWPLHARSAYKLAIADGALSTTNLGGSFGRMPVDPRLMKYADVVFRNLWDALKREKKVLDKSQSIKVEAGKIEVVTHPQPRTDA